MPNEIMKSSELARDRQSLFNYNSSHNNFPAIESLNPIDIGTERQFRFTAKMLADMFNISHKTVDRRVELLIESGDIQSGTNLSLIKIPDSNGRSHETTVYDLTVLNKLAMTMIDNPIAVNVRKAFNDVIVQVETTGSYNAIQLDRKTQLQLAIINSEPNSAKQLAAMAELEQLHANEKKALEYKNEQLEADNETLTQERDKAIQTKQQISDSKTAKALGRVGGLVTANNRLKDELYGNRNRRTIKAVAIANHLKDKDISHYALIKYCKDHNLEIIKVPDTNWNEVNSYPIEAFKALYPELIID